MEGITGHVFRRVHAECFGALDCYYTPFLPPPRVGNRFGGKAFKEIDPANNQGLNVVPQLMSKNADEFVWAAQVLADAERQKVALVLPIDVRVGITLTATTATVRDVENVANDDMALDIGPATEADFAANPALGECSTTGAEKFNFVFHAEADEMGMHHLGCRQQRAQAGTADPQTGAAQIERAPAQGIGAGATVHRHADHQPAAAADKMLAITTPEARQRQDAGVRLLVQPG